jgi:hypothetical protein
MPLTRRRFVQRVAAAVPIAAFSAERNWPDFVELVRAASPMVTQSSLPGTLILPPVR